MLYEAASFQIVSTVRDADMLTTEHLDLIATALRTSPATRPHPNRPAIERWIERERLLLAEPAGAPRGLALVRAAKRRPTVRSLGYSSAHAARTALRRAQTWAGRHAPHWLPAIDTVRVRGGRVITI